MRTATKLHDLLLGFRDDTGAQRCFVVSSDFGTRVEVGRPATLSADELEWGTPSAGSIRESHGDRFRVLSVETAGYSIGAEFESVDATDKARARFEALVHEVEALVAELP